MALTASLTRPQPRSSRGLISTLLAFGTLYSQRRALARLDDRALQDLGLTRAEVDIEASRPVWDAPDNWHA